MKAWIVILYLTHFLFSSSTIILMCIPGERELVIKFYRHGSEET